jgi:cell division protease FtsH
VVASLTPGFTGADLANLVNEAAMTATRRGADATTLDDFTVAFERIVAGIEKKSRVLSPRERKIVAHHEIGHAIVAMSLPGADPIQKVSIIPRGIGALGYTLQRPTEDRFLISKSELLNRMTVLLGGRAAEDLVFADVSTGASDDLRRATDIARDMVARFGMTPELGQVAYEAETGSFLVGQVQAWRPKDYSDGTAEAIDEAVRNLIANAFARARKILEVNRSLLEAEAGHLLDKETLDDEDLRKVANKLRIHDASEAL